MKNVILIIIVALALSSCVTPSIFNASSPQFTGKYTSQLRENETVVSSWYHFVTSFDSKGDYIVRIFFPETKQVTSYTTYLNKTARVKSGLAKKWYDNGHTKSEGVFDNNQKTGLWTFYSSENGTIQLKGIYVKNKEEGLWKYYNHNEKLIKKVNFKAGLKEGEFTQYDSLGSVINKGIYKADTVFQQTNPAVDELLEKMPFLNTCNHIKNEKAKYSCSEKALLKHISKFIKYPASAREYGIQGRAYTQFVIEKDGSVTNIKIDNGLCEAIKRECIRTLKFMPKWKAGTQNGENVRVKFYLPINFRLI